MLFFVVTTVDATVTSYLIVPKQNHRLKIANVASSDFLKIWPGCVIVLADDLADETACGSSFLVAWLTSSSAGPKGSTAVLILLISSSVNGFCSITT